MKKLSYYQRKKLEKSKKKPKKVKSYYKPKEKQSLEIIVKNQTSLIPTVQELVVPIRDGKDLSIPKTWMSTKQVTFMLQNTPSNQKYKRKGKGGGVFEYVTGSYIIKALNYAFGWNWDWEIVDKGKIDNFLWVQGKLTVKGPDGQTITKSAFGRSEIKFKKGTKEMLDYGNDLKAADTDALKKAASRLGFASDVYSKAEYKEETNIDPIEPTVESGDEYSPAEGRLKPGQVLGPDGTGVYLCSETGDIISEQEYTYSMKVFKKPLSREAQKNYKK